MMARKEGFRQHDPHEGLLLILDQLHVAQNQPVEPAGFSDVDLVDGKIAWEQYTLRHNSPIVQMYNGVKRTVLRAVVVGMSL